MFAIRQLVTPVTEGKSRDPAEGKTSSSAPPSLGSPRKISKNEPVLRSQSISYHALPFEICQRSASPTHQAKAAVNRHNSFLGRLKYCTAAGTLEGRWRS